MTSQVYTEESIKELINKSNLAVERGILAIFNRQTEDEKQIEDTRYYNRIGFSGAHVKIGTYMAKWILSGKHLNGPWIEKGRKMIQHYAKQLAEIANTRN